MNPDLKHLLGGYATNTLTPAEREQLFAAALEDQELFNALADEQALKELLDDPEARGYLKEALTESPVLLAAAAAAPAPRMAAAPRSAPAPAPVPAPAPPPVRTNYRFFALAASLLIVVSAGLWYLTQRPGPEPAAPAVVATRTDPPAAAAPAPSSAPAIAKRTAPPSPSKPVPAAAPPVAPAEARADAESKVAVVADAIPLAAPAYQLRRRNPQGEFVPIPTDSPLTEGDEIEIFVPNPLVTELRNAAPPPPAPAAAAGSVMREQASARKEAPVRPANRFTLKAGQNTFSVSGVAIRLRAAPKNP